MIKPSEHLLFGNNPIPATPTTLFVLPQSVVVAADAEEVRVVEVTAAVVMVVEEVKLEELAFVIKVVCEV